MTSMTGKHDRELSEGSLEQENELVGRKKYKPILFVNAGCDRFILL